jgi:hypothetical protein
LHVVGGLAGERWRQRHLRDPIRAIAARSSFRGLLAGGDVCSNRMTATARDYTKQRQADQSSSQKSLLVES